jgi:ABC-type transporter Mla subunit MlaD
MASLKETADQVTTDLENLVGQLRTELGDGRVDFARLVSISDEISEHADGLAETFNNVNDALTQRLQQVKQGSGASRRQTTKAGG